MTSNSSIKGFKSRMRNKFLIIIFLFSALPVLADFPLTIEDLITDKDKLKLDMSLAYTNSE
jgi:hypothetical protein